MHADPDLDPFGEFPDPGSGSVYGSASLANILY